MCLNSTHLKLLPHLPGVCDLIVALKLFVMPEWEIQIHHLFPDQNRCNTAEDNQKTFSWIGILLVMKLYLFWKMIWCQIGHKLSCSKQLWPSSLIYMCNVRTDLIQLILWASVILLCESSPYDHVYHLGSGAHFMKDVSIIIHIWWKTHPAVIQV